MAWVKLDDNFHWHPKVAPLSDGAYRLYVGALCYCNRYGQGDRVTATQVLGLAGRRSHRLASELVTARLWDIEGAGWLIHDYFSYQPDPKKREAGRLGGQASAQARAEASAQPPSRPVPDPIPLGVENPSVGSPDDDCLIESRGWTGGEESTAEVLRRYRPRQSVPHKEGVI